MLLDRHQSSDRNLAKDFVCYLKHDGFPSLFCHRKELVDQILPILVHELHSKLINVWVGEEARGKIFHISDSRFHVHVFDDEILLAVSCFEGASDTPNCPNVAWRVEIGWQLMNEQLMNCCQ